MDFDYSPEQQSFSDGLRRFVTECWPVETISRDLEKWIVTPSKVRRALGEDWQIYGLMAPESLGGAGFGPVELGLVLHEFGRALAGSEVLTVAALAVPLLSECADSDAQADYLPGLMSGALLPALALPAQAFVSPADVCPDLTAQRLGPDRYTIEGSVGAVLNGDTADLIIVIADCDGAPGLFVITPDAPGMTREELPFVDATRAYARVAFNGTPARRIDGEALGDRLAFVLQTAQVMQACDQMGAAEAALEQAVAYAKTREQFGVLIGSFQAIKHKCAEMLLAFEPSHTAARTGAWLAAYDPPALAASAALIKAECSTALYTIASHGVQIHGGTGITWDCPASWYFRRAVAGRETMGNIEACYERVAQQAGL